MQSGDHSGISMLRALVAGAALALVGCSSEAHTDEKPPPVADDGIANDGNYAPGPYGVVQGKTIANYEFLGFVNPLADSSTLQTIKLGDFYNPTGSEVFPEGSLYGAGKPKPKALLINVSAVWCGPCQYEADEILPVEYAKYKPLGGEFLLELADGPTPGTAALEKHLSAWTNKYDVDYPSTIDPQYQLGALFEAAAYPGNMIVRTKTMAIVAIVSGAPDQVFWGEFEGLLEEP